MEDTRRITLAAFHPLTHRWLLSDQALVVAVSGGADSMALLHLLVGWGKIPLDRLVVAHFDHQLRPDSRQDALFVEEVCSTLGVAVRIGCWEAASGRRGNLSASAREARYDFLLQVAHQVNADSVAVAHHRDDQAETFLERLLRGSGVRGLTAMSPTRPLDGDVALIRPLLAWRRLKIESWLQQRQLTWRDDPGNASLERRRGWLRHRLLPEFNRLVGRDLSPALAATAERLQQAEMALQWMVDQYWHQLDVVREGDALTLLHAPLMGLPDELVMRLIDRCRGMLLSGHPLSHRAVAGVLAMVRHHHPLVEVQGITLAKRGERILLMTGRYRSHIMNS